MAEYISEAEVLQRALDTYGSALQIVVMMEEMSELQKELRRRCARCSQKKSGAAEREAGQWNLNTSSGKRWIKH